MMKKAVAMIVAFTLLLFSAPGVFAAGTASLKSIKYAKNGGQDMVTIYTSNYKGYKVMRLTNPDRLVVDIPNNKLSIKGSQTIKVNSPQLKRIRFSQYTKTTTRVVFDTYGKIPYTVKTAAGTLTFLLGKASSGSGASDSKKASTASRGDVDRPAPVLQRLVFSSTDSYDKIVIPGSGYDGYNIFRLTDPDRIVIDVPKLALQPDQQHMEVNGRFSSSIRTSPQDASSTRIVFDTIGQPQYRVEKSSEQLSVILEQSPLKNISYHNAGDRIYLTLNNTRLTEISEDPAGNLSGETPEEAGTLKRLYTGGYDNTGIMYGMTFPANLYGAGFGTLQVNDGVMGSVDIKRDAGNGTVSITFNAKSRMVYEAITNPETNTTEISILKPYEAKDRLVVIDAGHGGHDPGAQAGGLNEKDLNLKIALKVNEILKEKGILTYMTRDDDTFIPLQIRADMANNLNASLFLSIHNNAYHSREFGTETLYYPGTLGSSFARIVQDTLVAALGTKNRGIIKRPNLVVLNATKMPAVIAEIAYMTNKEDRARLMDAKFIEKTARALADAVIKALE